MKVLFVHNFYRFRGGEERVVAQELELLCCAGHEARLHSLDSAALARDPLARRASRLVQVPYSFSEKARFARVLAGFKPDVVHVHNLSPFFSASLLDAVPAGTAVVASLHNFRPFCLNGFFLRDGRPCERCAGGNRLHGVLHRCYHGSFAASAWASAASLVAGPRLRGRVQRFLCPSRFLREKYVQYGFPASRLHLLPYSTSQPPGPFSRPAGRQGYGLFMGRLSEEKGVRVILDALGRLPDPSFVFAGGGPLEGETRAAVERAGWRRVRVLGQLPAGRINRLLAGAAFSVLPALWFENQPMAVLESLAAGVPVIASRLGGLLELVADGENGWLVEAGEAAGLAAAMGAAWACPPGRRRTMAAAGRAGWKAKFSPQVHRKGLLGAYRGAMAEARP